MRRRRPSLARQLLRGLVFGLLGVIALLALGVAMFPFARAAPLVAAAIERETRVAVTFEGIDVSLSLRGPVLTASGVTLAWPTGEVLGLDFMELRPAQPLAWLRGAPTAHVSARAAFGSFEGTISREAVVGRVQALDPEQLPQDWFGAGGSPLQGRVDASVDAARIAHQWSGRVKLDGGHGSLNLPGTPVAIPYERLHAAALLDSVGTLRIETLELEGPMVSAVAQGEVAPGYAGPATGTIRIEAQVERLDPALKPLLEPYGVPLGAGGAGQLTISGTPDHVQIR